MFKSKLKQIGIGLFASGVIVIVLFDELIYGGLLIAIGAFLFTLNLSNDND